MIYQDWFEHTDAVTQGALRRYREATGIEFSESLHNAGLLHDLGKLKPSIQAWYSYYCYLVHRCGLPKDALAAHTFFRGWTDEHKIADLETTKKMGRRPGHQSEGTALAIKQAWLDAAMIVAGHHGGLPDYKNTPENRSLQGRFTPKDAKSPQEALDLATKDFEESAEVAKRLISQAESVYPDCKLEQYECPQRNIDSEFFMRLKFSCLVDSDWDDTERWMKTQDSSYVELDPPPLHLLFDRIKNIEAYIQEERKKYSPAICRLRDSVYDYCLKSAPRPHGVFTLNAPTGSGKTVAALAWALMHAKANNLRRIIYVVPYLTIIEQNAEVIREALGIDDKDLFVFEHHSIADPPSGTVQESNAIRVRMANWTPSIIITTNVQMFDSLFHNRPGKCRKFHNIAGSVVIFDECQNVHPHYIQPTCQMINQFVKHTKSSFLLCTATQPQWHVQHKGLVDNLKSHAIIRNPGRLFARAERMQASWPVNGNNTWTIAELSEQVSNSKQSGAIVDTRKKAQELFQQLSHHSDSESIFHLSTSMCVLHRNFELRQLHSRLKTGSRCHLAATPILEAGVDISFPHIFREFGPYDLMIQAAGRGNRHGDLEHGLITVFRLLDLDGNCITNDGRHAPPDQWYREGSEVLNQFIKAEGVPDINRPDMLSSYYRKLYSNGDLDEKNISGLRAEWAFDTVAKSYRTIENQSRPVVCRTWHQSFGEVANKRVLKWFDYAKINRPDPAEVMSSVIDRVHSSLRERPFSKWLLSLMSYLSANIFWRHFQQIQEKTTLITTDAETGIDFWNGPYDSRIGLIY